MDITITCSECHEELQLSPEEYKNDGVDRWSVEPHICEAVEHLRAPDVAYCACSTSIVQNGICTNCKLPYKSQRR